MRRSIGRSSSPVALRTGHFAFAALAARFAFAALAALAGCGNFNPLSLNLGGSKALSHPDQPASVAKPTTAGDQADELAQRVRENAERVEKGMAKVDPSRRPGGRVDHVVLPSKDGSTSPGDVVGADGLQGARTGSPAGPAAKIDGQTGPQADGTNVGPSARRPTALSPAPGPTGLASSAVKANPNTKDENSKTQTPGSPPMLAEVGDPESRPPVVLASGPGGELVGRQPPRPSAGQPAGQPRTPNQTLAELISQVEKLAAAQPSDFRLQFQLRSLYLAAGRTRDAQGGWAAGSASDQKTLAAWVDAAVALAASRSSGGSAADAADPQEAILAALERLRQHLSEQAALKVRVIKLASRVDGYGILTPFEGDAYRPGQWVIVYAELENLTAQLEADGQYKSELNMRVEVLSAEGKSLLTQEDKQVVDRSLNQRRDFFLARRLRMPADMTSGQYVLRVSVEDRLAGKVGESMLRFGVK